MRHCFLHPEKAQYVVLEDAVEAAVKYRWEVGGHRLYPYRCPDCAAWHLTSDSRQPGFVVDKVLDYEETYIRERIREAR